MEDVPEDGDAAAPPVIELALPDELAGERLDKALARAAADRPGLSRSRLAQLIADGQVTDPTGVCVREPRAKVKPGLWRVVLPPPEPAEPLPEAIPLGIRHEDRHLIVVEKPAGMVVHPAPGAETGTLVNALLHHCGDSLAGIGGTRRPGIVHRIDKDTSGLLVVAKTAEAHAGLAALFVAHDVERAYLALARGAPSGAEARLAGLPGVGWEPGGVLRIDRPIARHPSDRKRMAVRAGGRRAVTRLRVLETLAGGAASLLSCRLETGRTHQIRVHAAHVGHPLLGDPVYGRGRISIKGPDRDTAEAIGGFPRQALHAARLGFAHPVTGQRLVFDSPLPPDMASLLEQLRRIGRPER